MFAFKTLFVCFIFFVHFSIYCHGYSYLQPIKFGDGECITDDWQIHPIGAIWYDHEKCEQLECIFHGDTLYIQGYGCGKIGHPKECWLIPGKGANYPGCCPQVACLDNLVN
ncbi:SVWC domain-containing protein [Caerostris darwini]|uniref:SVWC domain-containing protein n=1 Tax=Caerostris darwini TaxID=1538125 RepID=A0AAV4W1V7_9ARAC|nr:SVWC domain-containing protein [Caerostris darwini]